eukprot:gnl/MRDRNA2_/MRDRNA2_17734_c0_seq1.p1 gnl/MRDRNA2_/MRDRNA2_17734_c0~~gnl/MRDRNA2_/MRDRNA2_17734_c0_seq1.p1  ORF type:complete len:381 (+),score=123.11 gnl/MRDRNA2_/MRDRNA2_17734_c0_seq1:50-1144(+)
MKADEKVTQNSKKSGAEVNPEANEIKLKKLKRKEMFAKRFEKRRRNKERHKILESKKEALESKKEETEDQQQGSSSEKKKPKKKVKAKLKEQHDPDSGTAESRGKPKKKHADGTTKSGLEAIVPSHAITQPGSKDQSKRKKKISDNDQDDTLLPAKRSKTTSRQIPKESSQPAKEKEQVKPHRDDSKTVYVGGLPFEAVSAKLWEYFAKCGEIDKLRMPTASDGKPKGIAFIGFKDDAGVEAALKLHGTEYGGRWLQVNRYQAGGGSAGSDAPTYRNLTVFVGGLPYHVSEEKLRKDFSKRDEIQRLDMPVKDDGTYKGIAFITYKSEKGMKAALKFNGKEYEGRFLRVNVLKKSEKEKERKGR